MLHHSSETCHSYFFWGGEVRSEGGTAEGGTEGRSDGGTEVRSEGGTEVRSEGGTEGGRVAWGSWGQTLPGGKEG